MAEEEIMTDLICPMQSLLDGDMHSGFLTIDLLLDISEWNEEILCIIDMLIQSDIRWQLSAWLLSFNQHVMLSCTLFTGMYLY